MIELAARAASTGLVVEVGSIGPAVAVAAVIWTVKLRIDHAAIFQASGSRAFRAGALIDWAADLADSAVIVLVVEDSVAAVIDLAAGGLAGLAASAAVAGSEVGAKINARNFPILFL
jgi:hypothetical protein